MRESSHNNDILIEFDCQFKIQMQSCTFSSIMKAFLQLFPQLLEEFFQKVLVSFAEYEMGSRKKSFACKGCGNDTEFKWKTRHGKPTSILTLFCWITLRQLQVQCNHCGRKLYLTRTLLGMESKKRIPNETRRKLALIGALTSFRVSEKIGSMFGWAINKMTIWKSVQHIGSKMEFLLDGNEQPRGEADGTGIGINGITKRGKELKVFVQYKIGGGIRVAGIDIGNYNGSWKKVFQKSIDVIKGFNRPFLLLTDGDTSIFDSLKEKVNVLIQRCLWHIPYQAKYFLWKDSVKRKSEEWLYVVAELMEICAIRPMVDCWDTIEMMLESKRNRLEALMEYCRKQGYTHILSYLENARGDMFTAIENRLEGKTTSKVERLFRTVNMRSKVSKWSMQGALNVTKVRLAYYYNGFDV